MYTRQLFNYRGLLEIVKEKAEQAKRDIIQRMKDNDQYVTGKTANAIRVEGETTADGCVVRIVAPLHIATLEHGRKPGKVPANFYKTILQWTIDKKMSFKTMTERRSFAYFTARKIKEEGSFLHRFGYNVDLYTGICDKFVKDLRETANFGNLYDITAVVKIIDQDNKEMKI